MKRIELLMFLILAAGLQIGVAAETNPQQGTFKQNHPRRAEVNHRERRQHARVRQGVKSGELTPDQAKQLRQNDAAIKKEERQDVKQNGGYLTKDQQKDINHQLNQNSKEIYQEKHPQ